MSPQCDNALKCAYCGLNLCSIHSPSFLVMASTYSNLNSSSSIVASFEWEPFLRCCTVLSSSSILAFFNWTLLSSSSIVASCSWSFSLKQVTSSCSPVISFCSCWTASMRSFERDKKSKKFSVRSPSFVAQILYRKKHSAIPPAVVCSRFWFEFHLAVGNILKDWVAFYIDNEERANKLRLLPTHWCDLRKLS